METLQDVLGAEIDSVDGNAEAPDQDFSSADTEGSDSSQDQADPSLEDNEPLFNREQYLKEHPELVPIAKAFQADYTRKTQELAEQRKLYEGLDEQTLAGIRYVNSLAETDPAAAAQYLEQMSAQLKARVQQPVDQFADLEFATDTERVLAERLHKIEQQFNQQQIAHFSNEIDRRFAALEKDYGEIPMQERAKVTSWMAERNMRVDDLDHAFRALNHDKLVQAAVAKARDHASGIVTKKSGMAPPPAGVSAREATGPREPKSLMEAIEMSVSG